MSDTKFIKQLQTRLSRRGLKLSYDEIRPTFQKHWNGEDDPTEEQVTAVLAELLQAHQPTALALEKPEPETVLTLANTPTPNQIGEDAADLTASQPPLLIESSTTPPATSLALPSTEEHALQPPDNPRANVSVITTVAPQEAIEIIQEIAADDSSRHQDLAQQLINQANSKTDTIVALVAALPEIEAEMLRRKLQRMPRKQVAYEEVLDSYFQKSQQTTSFINTLAAQYGVTLSL